PGPIRDAGEPGKEQVHQVIQLVSFILDDFRREHININIVSGGSTPSLYRSHEIEGLNEIRPGTYVYNDVNTVATGACTFGDCAASVLVTVVSTARKGQIIVDGRSKTFSYDPASVQGPSSSRLAA